MFLKVISKVLFSNITQRFTISLVQLSIFLIVFFVGTYRLSSHARLEAFVILTKLTLSEPNEVKTLCLYSRQNCRLTSSLSGIKKSYQKN